MMIEGAYHEVFGYIDDFSQPANIVYFDYLVLIDGKMQVRSGMMPYVLDKCCNTADLKAGRYRLMGTLRAGPLSKFFLDVIKLIPEKDLRKGLLNVA